MELLCFLDISGEPRLWSGSLGQIAMATSIDDGVSLHWGDMLVIAAYFLISIGVGVSVSICRVFWTKTVTENLDRPTDGVLC